MTERPDVEFVYVNGRYQFKYVPEGETTKQHLPADVSRCLDSTCPNREQCLRWVGRNDDHPRLTMSQTLNPRGEAHCVYRLLPDRRDG